MDVVQHLFRKAAKGRVVRGRAPRAAAVEDRRAAALFKNFS